MVAGLVGGPDLLDRLDPLAHDREPPRRVGAVVAHLLEVPAGADAEQHPPAGEPVDARHLLRGHDRVALDHQADPGAEPDPLGRRAAAIRATNGSWVRAVLARQLAADRVRGLAAGRDVGVVGEEQRLEGALLDHPRQGRRVDALVGGEVADRELHAPEPTAAVAAGATDDAERRQGTAQQRVRAREPEGVAVLGQQDREGERARHPVAARPAPRLQPVERAKPPLGAPAGRVSQITLAGSAPGFHIWCTAPSGISISSPGASSRSSPVDADPQRSLEDTEALALAGVEVLGRRLAAGPVLASTSSTSGVSLRSSPTRWGQLQRLGHLGTASAALDLLRDRPGARRVAGRVHVHAVVGEPAAVAAHEPRPVDDPQVLVVRGEVGERLVEAGVAGARRPAGGRCWGRPRSGSRPATRGAPSTALRRCSTLRASSLVPSAKTITPGQAAAAAHDRDALAARSARSRPTARPSSPAARRGR